MIVEDEAVVSDFIVAILEDSHHEVVGVAETGADALQLAEAECLDLALVDIKLRGRMDGLELAGRLREQWPDLRIVFASGSHDPTNWAKAEALAPAGFLRKPFMPGHLLAVLDRIGDGEKGDVD